MVLLLDFGMRIKIAEIRKRLGMSQAELADAVGISRAYMSQIESGARNMTVRRQQMIAKHLGVEPASLVDFSGATEADKDAIIQIFEAADDDQRALILRLARSVLDR